MLVKELHVGQLIRATLNEQNIKLLDVAKKIGISKQTFNGWLKKDDISVKDLFTISEAINYDLVKRFCLPNENEQETKVVLHIEVEKNKVNDVLKIVQDKQLYNILKNSE